jgi:uncharacterized membrane protein
MARSIAAIMFGLVTWTVGQRLVTLHGESVFEFRDFRMWAVRHRAFLDARPLTRHGSFAQIQKLICLASRWLLLEFKKPIIY